MRPLVNINDDYINKTINIFVMKNKWLLTYQFFARNTNLQLFLFTYLRAFRIQYLNYSHCRHYFLSFTAFTTFSTLSNLISCILSSHSTLYQSFFGSLVFSLHLVICPVIICFNLYTCHAKLILLFFEVPIYTNIVIQVS